jgi:hypothetical protein
MGSGQNLPTFRYGPLPFRLFVPKNQNQGPHFWNLLFVSIKTGDGDAAEVLAGREESKIGCSLSNYTVVLSIQVGYEKPL